MTALTRWVDRCLITVLVACMTGLVMTVLWQVASRFLLDDPSSYTEEIARFLLLWIGLLGGCYAYRNHSHLGLDIVTSNMNEKGRRLTAAGVTAVVAAFSLLVLCYGGGNLVWLTLDLRQTSAAMGIPMGYVYSILPLSGVLLLYYSAATWREQIT